MNVALAATTKTLSAVAVVLLLSVVLNQARGARPAFPDVRRAAQEAARAAAAKAAKEEAAATRIQSHARARGARKEAAGRRVERRAQVDRRATTRMQSQWCGHGARGAEAAAAGGEGGGGARERGRAQPTSAQDVAAALHRRILDNGTFFMGDDSRTRVIELYCNTIGRLVTGGLVDVDRYNSLLLGRKAVGKSKILEVVADACTGVLGKHVTVVNVNACSTSGHRQLSQSSLRGMLAASMRMPLTSDVEDVAAELKKRDHFMVVLMDEFDTLYTAMYADEASRQIILDAITLAASKSGRFFFVVSGSSAHLRRLCFARLGQDVSGFPNYFPHRSLNHTKL
jgi:hypothetical protein